MIRITGSSGFINPICSTCKTHTSYEVNNLSVLWLCVNCNDESYPGSFVRDYDTANSILIENGWVVFFHQPERKPIDQIDLSQHVRFLP